jgi:hypothetical protein
MHCTEHIRAYLQASKVFCTEYVPLHRVSTEHKHAHIHTYVHTCDDATLSIDSLAIAAGSAGLTVSPLRSMRCASVVRGGWRFVGAAPERSAGAVEPR